MSVAVDIRLRSIEEYIREVYGKDRKPTPNEVFIIADAVEDVVNYIKRRWPVDTGTSRDRWTHELRFNSGELVITIENEMYYVGEVVDPADGETPLWQGLVTEAWQQHKEKLFDALKAEIDVSQDIIRWRKAQGDNDREAILYLARGLLDEYYERTE